MSKFLKTAEYLSKPELRAALESGEVILIDKQAGTRENAVHMLFAQKAKLSETGEAFADFRKLSGAYRRMAAFNVDVQEFPTFVALPIGSAWVNRTLIRSQSLATSQNRKGEYINTINGQLNANALPMNGGIAVDANGVPVYQTFIPAVKGAKDQPSIVAGSITMADFEAYRAAFGAASVEPAEERTGTRTPSAAPVGG